MKIAQLREVFKVAARQYKDAGNAEAAQALSKFATNLLSTSGDSTVAAFVARIEKARGAASSPRKTKRKQKR